MTFNIITLFSGIGTQEMAMKRVLDKDNVHLHLVNFCEFNPRISKCFCILHNTFEEKNLGDITKLNVDEYETKEEIDLIVSSFPCQSFSIAGKKQGFKDKTKGNLYDMGFRLIEKVRPRVVIYENVKGILHPRHNAIEKITSSMESIGYTCKHKVLNAIDYGIPQNRERWFMVCIRNDIEGHDTFTFPPKVELTRKVEDFIDKTITTRACTKAMTPYFDPQYHHKFKSVRGLMKVYDGISSKHFTTGFTTCRIYSIKGVSPTFTTSNDCHFMELGGKLDAKERFLLMGCSEKDYNTLIEHKISKRLIDFISGNAIVVDVFEHLFQQVWNLLDSRKVIKDTDEEKVENPPPVVRPQRRCKKSLK